MNRYYIRNIITGEVWSNRYGWIKSGQCTLFSYDEKEVFTLPIDGQWVPNY